MLLIVALLRMPRLITHADRDGFVIDFFVGSLLVFPFGMIFVLFLSLADAGSVSPLHVDSNVGQ